MANDISVAEANVANGKGPGCSYGVPRSGCLTEEKLLAIGRQNLAHGGPGYLQFAITNICNAKCDFCGFAVGSSIHASVAPSPWMQARDVIDISVKNHIGYLFLSEASR